MRSTPSHMTPLCRWALAVIIIAGWCLLPGQVSPALADTEAAPVQYYVDSVHGSDQNSGKSPSEAWQTLTPVNAKAYRPGDIINFVRGSVWNQALSISRSGTSDRPIIYRAYGSGPKPIITNPKSMASYPKAVNIYSRWVIVEGLALRDTAYDGIFLDSSAEHNVIRECEITNVGQGIEVYGQYNLITRNYIHDLRMVRNTPDSPDDDYGAIGVTISNANNEISYNRLVNCQGASYDYGRDGGAIELYGIANNTRIHHNLAENNLGFLEAGGSSDAGREANDILVDYNVLVDNTWALHFNLAGSTYAVNVQRFRFENNTVVQIAPWETAINFVVSPLTGDQLQVRNNIFAGFYQFARVLKDGHETLNSGFIHEHNLYEGIGRDFALNTGETLADPAFVNRSAQDYHLRQDSPAIDAGVNLGYSADYDSMAVPTGSAPDLGALEYGAARPTSLSVMPVSGPVSGGTKVQVAAEGLDDRVTIMLGDQPCTDPRLLEPGRIECQTPSHDAGPVDVVALSPDGSSRLLPDGYKFEVNIPTGYRIYVPQVHASALR